MADALVCTGCSAPLPAPDAEGLCTCAYCGRVHDRGGHVWKVAATLGDAPAAVGLGRAITVIAVVLSVGTAGIGLVAALVTALGASVLGAAVTTATSGTSTATSSWTQAITAAAPPRELWDDVGGDPLPIRVGERTLVLGRTRRVGSDDALFVVAFDPADASEVWRAGPYGSYADAYQSVMFAAAGDTVVVTDGRAVAHLLSAADGKERSAITLTDVADEVCVREGRVRVEQKDDRSVAIDPATGAAVDAVGRVCPDAWMLRHSPLGHRAAPKVKGLRVEHAVPRPEGGWWLGGQKDPGTGVPKAASVDADGTVRWLEALPQVDLATVREGVEGFGADARHVAATYAVGQEETRLTLRDAATGALVWDVVLRPIFAVDDADRIVLTEERVLVVRTSSLDVFDRRDGRQVGTVGQDTYDDAL